MTSKWEPGVSGNPNGRPKGTGEVAKLRLAITERLPEVIEVLIQRALEGDISAAKLLLERTVSPLRAQDVPVRIDLPADDGFTEQGRAVLQAVLQEGVDPGMGFRIIKSIENLSRICVIDELEKRIRSLEERAK
jgi:hypothetical protein